MKSPPVKWRVPPPPRSLRALADDDLDDDTGPATPFPGEAACPIVKQGLWARLRGAIASLFRAIGRLGSRLA